MDLAEQQREHISGAELERAQYFSRYSEVFEKMVAWQAEQEDMNEAFDAIERARARSLLDELSLPGVDLQVGRSAVDREQLRQQEATLRAEIAKLETQQRDAMQAGAEQTGRQEIEQKLAVARRRCTSTIAMLVVPVPCIDSCSRQVRAASASARSSGVVQRLLREQM